MSVCCALLAALAPAAQAGWKPDPGFGSHGVLEPPRLPGYVHQSADAALVGPHAEIDLVMSATGDCPYECQRDLRVLRYRADGTLKSGFGEPGRGLLLGSFAPRARASTALDPDGGIVVANGGDRKVSVFRYAWDGSFDSSFGNGGVAKLECLCEPGPSLFVDGDGRALLSGQEGERVFEARLLADGTLDAGFGFGGVNAVRTEGSSEGPWLPLPNGSVLYGRGSGCCGPPRIARWTAAGHPDTGFEAAAAKAIASLPVKDDLRPEWVAGMVPRGGGKLDVIGSTHELGRGYVLRLRRDGSRDETFGHGGIHVYGFRFQRLLPVGRGRVLVVTDGAARMLMPDGTLAKGYNGSKGMQLPKIARNERPIALRHKRMLFIDYGTEFCRGYCEPRPRLIQLRRYSGKHRHRG